MCTTTSLVVAAAVVGLTAGWLHAGGQPSSLPAADQPELTRGNTAFALDLHRRLAEKPGNLFVCPLSLSTALAMTYAGARGETATQMAGVLHFELPPERLHPAFAAMLAKLDAPDCGTGHRLHVANALWVQSGYTLLPEFLAVGRAGYRAGLESLDFVADTEGARQTINNWVAARTEQKIQELIGPGILSQTTRLVLTNAIYFKGAWAARFDPQATHDAPFTLADGRQVSAPLMFQEGEFGYFEQPELQGLELAYAGDRFSMVILLPRTPVELSRLERSLSPERLNEWLGGLSRQKVRVWLPRFSVTAEFRLDEALRAMGMRDAFDPSRADFSGMDGTRNLYIGAVLHKAFVEVNEEGTEAAGASAVVMKLRATPEPPPSFRADHPFLFLIRDLGTGSVLFTGRLANPAP
mgnify:CR=1 FL=1